MAELTFSLIARVSSDDPEAVAPALDRALPAGSTIVPTADGFEVEARLSGESARELNRALLSALRRACKRTRLRAEWTSEDGRRERFFDYSSRGVV